MSLGTLHIVPQLFLLSCCCCCFLLRVSHLLFFFFFVFASLLSFLFRFHTNTYAIFCIPQRKFWRTHAPIAKHTHAHTPTIQYASHATMVVSSRHP